MPYVLHIFDPWKSPLCTCPTKYSLSPYTGCGHACRYCYITSYIRNAFNPRTKKNFLYYLKKDLAKANLSIPISISNSSDPYTPPEDKIQLTREALKLISSFNAKAIIITKSSLVVRDLDILRKGKFTVSMSITTLNNEISQKLEPHASLPYMRINALKNLCREKIPCSIRIDPIIPEINDDYNSIREIVSLAAEIGIDHIVSSTYKAKSDNFKRLLMAFPNKSEILRTLYIDEGVKIGRIRYLNEKIRFNYMKMIKELADEFGLTFSTCREGFKYLHTSKTCDGTHLIPD
jgi:DNA repair photolyase